MFNTSMSFEDVMFLAQGAWITILVTIISVFLGTIFGIFFGVLRYQVGPWWGLVG